MSRIGFLVAYALLAAALVACQVAALRWSRFPTLGQVIALTTRTRLGRVLVLTVWLWVGWHTFVRSTPG